MKHTPGPWKIVNHSWSDTGIYANHEKIALLKIDDDIEEDDQEQLEAVQEANAKLIAAAPQMREALEKLAKLGNEIALNALIKAGVK